MSGINVKEVLDDIWHRGLDGTNVHEFEKARAAVAELIAEVEGAIEAISDGDAQSAIRALTAALARAKGEQP
jgi:hypothetical protein